MSQIVRDIAVYCNKPMDNLVPRSRASQAALRWTYLLRNEKYCLPNYAELRILMIENQSVTAVEPELQSSPAIGFWRDFYVFVPHIPSNTDDLPVLANECIWRCLLIVSQGDPDALRKIASVMAAIDSGEECLAIPRKTISRKSFSAELLIRPCGDYPTGGEILLSILDKATGQKTTKKLFSYCHDGDACSYFGSLSLNDHALKVIARSTFKNQYPGLPSEIYISVPHFCGGQSEREWLLTDLTELRRQFLDHDLPW
ncbi:hypothetical protein BH11CYA1_BH11CYA1_07700 [soil metagenome]